MRPEREAVKPGADGVPAVDDEREVDVGRYFDTLVAHWWLPALGLLVGVALGFLLSVSSKDVWRAQATVYAGSPYTNNTPIINSLATNQGTITRIVKSEETIAEVSSEAGISRKKLREGISTQRQASGLGRLVPSQLYVISVKGDERGPTQRASQLLAERVVDRIGGFARTKIDSFGRLLRSLNSQLEALDVQVRETQEQLQRGGLSTVERLILVNTLQIAEQRRGTVEQDRSETLQFLALANEVELPRVLDRPVAVKTTARSPRNTVAIAAFLGLLLGIFAALLWEPITSRQTRD
jgi:predicted transcriptional regulator